MSTIQTIHRNEDGEQYGETETIRRVTVEDATGQEHTHDFEVTEDGHEYLGDGRPPDSAIKEIATFEEESEEFSAGESEQTEGSGEDSDE